jgi:hypothetical protein
LAYFSVFMAWMLEAMPGMRSAPIDSTRACSTASKNQPRFGALRRHHRMGVGVMAGEAQRHGITEAAGDRDFLCGRFLGDFRQAHALTGKARPLIGENDLDFGIAGNGSHTSGNRLTQRLRINSRTRFCSGIVAARCHCLSCHLPTRGDRPSICARSAGIFKSSKSSPDKPGTIRR